MEGRGRRMALRGVASLGLASATGRSKKRSILRPRVSFRHRHRTRRCFTPLPLNAPAACRLGMFGPSPWRSLPPLAAV